MIHVFQKYPIYGLILLLLCQCQKTDVPEPSVGTPVFSLAADLDGTGIAIKAGIDDFYMFTSHDQDSCGQVILQGELAKTNDCTQSCEEAFKIELTYVPPVQGAVFVVDAALSTTNNYTFADTTIGQGEYFEGRFTAFAEGNPPFDYAWDFGDGEVSSEANPVHDYPASINKYTVTLSTMDVDSCERTYQREIGIDTIVNQCQADFSIINNSPTLQGFIVEAIPKGLAPFIYSWSTGETTSMDTITLDTFQAELICLQIIDATGCRDSLCKELTVDVNSGMPEICSTRFEHEVEFIPSEPTACVGGFQISYTSPSGIVYRSDLGPSQIGDFITLDEVEDFDDNEKGEKTKKVELNFSTTLYSSDGSALPMTNARATIGFAYPEN